MSNRSSTILHKRNSVAGTVPSLTSLSAGEIAINTADGKLFIKSSDNTIKQFLNNEQQPFVLSDSLSSVHFQYSNNIASNILAQALGGMDNAVYGAGSTILNGSDNYIEADYAFITNGNNNRILSGGDFGAILGGQNNILNHQESFILGSNITSHLSGFTYVNSLSVTGKIYVDGSEISGLGTDTEVRALTSNWENTYTSFRDASSTFLTSETDSQTLTFNEGTKDLSISNGNTVSLSALIDLNATDSEVRALTANWDNTYTTVQTNSADWNYQGTDIKNLSANWENTYTTFKNVSSTFLTSETDSQTLTFDEGTKDLTISNGNTVSLSALVDAGLQGADTEVRGLTANWESTYVTVSSLSGSWGGGGSSDIIDLTFKTAYTTYYHELQYDSVTSNLSAVQIYEDNTKVTHLFEKLLTYTSTALLTGISITDKVNNNTLTKTLSYDGSDNLISTTRIYT